MPLHVSSTCAYRQEGKLYYIFSGIITPIDGRPVLSQSVHGTATYRCDDTRDCIIKFALLTMSTCARNM